ncbi:MAG: hypothetical protein Ct9H300mP12_16380 [Acidimicrobiales bacterium]|nr:MAG: hypothetical protein Ct9H300mP12_16380 [Acidimicrobiales bacterium]
MPPYVPRGSRTFRSPLGAREGVTGRGPVAETVAEMLRGRDFDPVVFHRDVGR